jgi:hypothetical protein
VDGELTNDDTPEKARVDAVPFDDNKEGEWETVTGEKSKGHSKRNLAICRLSLKGAPVQVEGDFHFHFLFYFLLHIIFCFIAEQELYSMLTLIHFTFQ